MPDATETRPNWVQYKGNTYEIISKIAYLIGVRKEIFENEHEPPQIDVYQRLNADKNARIIRNLCIIRTKIERNFKKISEKMRFEFKSFFSIPEYIPSEAIQGLAMDGIELGTRTSTRLTDYLIEVNRLISDRINNCKPLFPLWLSWDYVKNLFVMPNGLSEQGTKVAAATYYQNYMLYPYQMYINWIPADEGNILYNDRRFVSSLYNWNNDEFTDFSKVGDAGTYVKGSIYDYIEESNQVVVVVDCENSDPYKLSATLRSLDIRYLEKIRTIILFDDVHTASAWSILEKFTKIPVEHITIERIKQNKSLVDIMLTARACQEYYENKVDSFIMVSSDSDYWGLISSLPKARFLLMIEREKCGADMKAALVNTGIFYCYLDDFYSGDSEELKLGALFREMRNYMIQSVKLNVNDMLDDAFRATRVEMSAPERQQFFDKYVRTLQLRIDENGNVFLEIKMK